MENMTAKFASAVLSRRKQLRLTQQEVADRVGTSKQMVSKYELGQRSPKVAMANAFADALDTTLDELLGTDKAELLMPVPYCPQTDEAKQIAIGVDRLPEEQREKALAMFRVMFGGSFEKE